MNNYALSVDDQRSERVPGTSGTKRGRSQIFLCARLGTLSASHSSSSLAVQMPSSIEHDGPIMDTKQSLLGGLPRVLYIECGIIDYWEYARFWLCSIWT